VTIILGIDPGSIITGYGIIKSNGNSLQYLTSGSIHLDKKPFVQRLTQIYTSLAAVVSEYQPDEVAIEGVFVNANVNSALKLGQARGAAIVAVASEGVTVAEYSPRQIKQSIVGYGGAEKSQVAKMVKLLLKLQSSPQADEADALAIALCHAYHRKSALRGIL